MFLGHLQFLFYLKVENSETLQYFHGVLATLLSSESQTVSFEGAVLLTKLKVVRGDCLEILHKALHDLSPATQSLVSLHMRPTHAAFALFFCRL